MDDLKIHIPLLIWYSKNKRDLPWRMSSKAYNVWLSEIILQQTRIEQGLSYYNKIISRVPCVCDMAKLSEEEMLFLWQGLGYYSRARNMLQTAQKVCKEMDGEFPNAYSELLKLKGVGPYTAAAISSIVSNEHRAAVDGNLIRVISRLHALPGSIGPKLQKEVQTLADKMIPKDSPGDFNQAMMDLGSMVCKPKAPLCDQCPLADNCLAKKTGQQQNIPQPKQKIKIRKRFFNYYLFIDKDEQCLISKRTEDDIWKGLFQFPLIETDKIKVTSDTEIMEIFHLDNRNFEFIDKTDTIKHILSHQHIYGNVTVIRGRTLPQIENQIRVKVIDLDNYPMSILIRKLLSKAEAII